MASSAVSKSLSTSEVPPLVILPKPVKSPANIIPAVSGNTPRILTGRITTGENSLNNNQVSSNAPPLATLSLDLKPGMKSLPINQPFNKAPLLLPISSDMPSLKPLTATLKTEPSSMSPLGTSQVPLTADKVPQIPVPVAGTSRNDPPVLPPLVAVTNPQTTNEVSSLEETPSKNVLNLRRINEIKYCSTCSQYVKKNVFKSHEIAHMCSKNITCRACLCEFTTLLSYQDHKISFHERIKIYRCFLKNCLKRFSSIELYKRHRLAHTAIMCEFCLKVVPGSNEYIKHIYNCHNQSQIDISVNKIPNKASTIHKRTVPLHYQTKICTLCRLYVKKTVFEDHLKAHMCTNYINCNICLIDFTTLLTYSDHKLIEHDKETNFQCFVPTCLKKFTDFELFKRHRVNHMCIKCEFCLKVVENDKEYKEHIYEEHYIDNYDEETRRVKCKQCDKIVYIGSMHNHILTKHKPYRYFCPSCPVKFHYLYALKNHVNSVHKDLAREVCDICGKRLLTKSLALHKKLIHEVHEKEKCPLCPKEFTTKVGLRHHTERCHDRKTNFFCENCGKGFYDARSFRRHKLVESGQKLKCAICSKLYSTSVSLRLHMRVHNLPILQCRFCDKTFTSPINFNIHIKMHIKNMKVKNEKQRESLLMEHLADTSSYKRPRKKKTKKNRELVVQTTVEDESTDDSNEKSEEYEVTNVSEANEELVINEDTVSTEFIQEMLK